MISIANQLEIRHFEYFLVLSETLHYGKAAERLFITQSALSQQIQRMETILGQELFVRTNRKVNLSHAGELLKEEAGTILTQMKKSMEQWRFRVEGGEGIVRIGFVGSAMQAYLPKLLKEFTAGYPKIRFHLTELSNRDQLQALDKKELDIGFVRSNNFTASMQSQLIFKETLTLVLPENHAINETNFVDMGQLADESYILFPNESSQMFFGQIIALCREYGFTPRISHQSIHGPTIFKLVESGLGISIVPTSLVDKFNYKVKYIELKEIKHQTELFAVWNRYNDNMAFSYFLKLMKAE
ncbi:LysR substrate-binding domain-containing protein [Fulvivirga kasyanovii]|uniref:LysR family transcriptional regulator n=1 Tax=Fulvivirga kasyanovii TaxID=396812 RepID=A0ABW9RN97_9BACT|nr:LysR family transcriptional regulator [Fulvivirga kasyanovii]MTI25386.1 LysR family transcriptional regulator [Fulvivirga kasyanovii]